MRHSAVAMIAALLVAGCAETLAGLAAPRVDQDVASLRTGAYSLDDDHAALVFRVRHMGLSDFVGRFDRLEARLDFDAAAPTAAALDVIVDVASLNLPNAGFAQTLKGGGWLDVARFPTARFRSTAVRVTGAATGEVDGVLTLHGIDHPQTLRVKFEGGGRDLIRGGYVVGFSAETGIRRSDYGIDKFEGVVGDTVSIRFDGEFIRR